MLLLLARWRQRRQRGAGGDGGDNFDVGGGGLLGAAVGARAWLE